MKYQLMEDLGSEPDSDRGVALKDPVQEEKPVLEAVEQSKAEEPEQEVKEEIAEGQEQPVEEQEADEATPEEDQAEGHFEPLYFNDYVKDTGWTLEQGYRDLYVKDEDGNPIPLGEALDVNKDLRGKYETLQQEHQQLKEQAVQSPPMQQYSPEAAQLMQDAQYLRRSLEANIKNGTFAKMDDVEALKLREEMRDNIEGLIQAANQKQQEFEVNQAGALREYERQVQTQFRKSIPEWKSDSVRSQELSALSDFLRSSGADQQTIEQVTKYNPWATKMFRRLWQLERAQAETKKAIRDVKKVPRNMRPSARAVAPKANIKAVGEKYRKASRREQDRILLNEDLGVAPS